MVAELDIAPELQKFLDLDLGIASEEEVSPLTNASDSLEFEEPRLEPLECRKCHKLYSTRRGLNQHMGKVHSTKRRHCVCTQCGSSFRHKYALRFHMKQVHDKTTRVTCHLCGLQLYNKYMLPKHLAKLH